MENKKIQKFYFSAGGFSLMEVLIAISMFAFFFVVFSTSILSNKRDSQNMHLELQMLELTEKKMEEIILAPPTFSEALTLAVEKKKFEGNENADFEYTVEWKRLELPNFLEMMEMQQKENDAQSGAQPSTINPQVKTVLEKIQKSFNESLWQLRITVIHLPTQTNYSLTNWMQDATKKVVIP